LLTDFSKQSLSPARSKRLVDHGVPPSTAAHLLGVIAIGGTTSVSAAGT
jgi:hypothetical protein